MFNGMEEKFEDTKEVIRNHRSKKDRQSNGQNKKNKKTNNDRHMWLIIIYSWLTHWGRWGV